jgi:hypothetical protein
MGLENLCTQPNTVPKSIHAMEKKHSEHNALSGQILTISFKIGRRTQGEFGYISIKLIT